MVNLYIASTSKLLINMFLVILLLVYVISFTDDGDSGSLKRLFLFMHIDLHVNKMDLKILALVFNFVLVCLHDSDTLKVMTLILEVTWMDHKCLNWFCAASTYYVFACVRNVRRSEHDDTVGCFSVCVFLNE